MKTIFYTFTAFLITTAVASAQVRVGAKASLQLANLKVTDGSGGNESTGQLTGFQAGVMIDAPLGEHFSLRPQLLYSIKGAKESLGSGNDVKLTFNYLEIPVQLTYGFDAGPGRIVLGAGPYVGYALSGKTTLTVGGKTESEPTEFGSNQGQVKRIDFGFHVSAGYELTSGLLVSGYYSPGLANLANSSAANGTVKNTAFGVSLGYFFGGK